MKRSTKIIIGALVVVLIAAGGAYGLTRQGAMPEDEGRTTETPIGLPNFPSGTPTPDTQPDFTPDLGQPPIPDSDPEVISTTQPDTEPDSTLTPTPTTDATLGSETFTINTTSGPVEINDVLLNPDAVFAEGWGVLVKETPQYSISYFTGGQTFSIQILDADVNSALALAQQNFLTILGISKEDACKLDVRMQVQSRINDEFEGIDFWVSYCLNGVAL